MFLIKADTNVRVIRDGQEWYAPNFREWKTRQDNFFEKHEMVIDPTFIATWTPPANGVTIGSAYADAGWYGFRRDGFIVLCPATHVHYVD